MDGRGSLLARGDFCCLRGSRLAGSHARVLLDCQLRSDKDAGMNDWTFPYRLIVELSLMLCLIVFSFPVHAVPIAQATGPGGEVVTIMDEPCALKHIVDLSNRATWSEKGKTFEGCASPHPIGVVVLFFKEDKTIAIIPMRAFQQMRSM